MKISKALSEKYGISVRAAKSYIKNGDVSLDENIAKKDAEYTQGELVLHADTKRPSADPENFIAKEYDYITYFDKPVNMHTELQTPSDPLTMEDILNLHAVDYSFVSRLDYTTDGIIAGVWNEFFVFDTKKVYLAFVKGEMKESTVMDNLIDASKRKKVKVLDQPGGNRTVFTPLEQKNGWTLVKAEFSMASRHQLRAYLSHLGFPIIGDTLYGGPEHHRLMLHCKETYLNGFPGISRLTDSFLSSIY